MEKLMEQILVFFKKLGTVLIDRRFWSYLFLLGITLGVIPATMDADQTANEVVTAVELIVQGATALAGFVALVLSWTKRPPTGMNYQPVPPEVLDVASAILKEIKAAKG